MAPDAEALRAILKQYIGPAYDRALRNTGEPEAAKEATRRAMELLKRACMDGVEPTKALVLRITDDCCNEKAFFNRQVEVERQKLQEGDGAEAAPEPAPKGKALLGGKRFQEAAEKPAESHIKAAPRPWRKAGANADHAKNQGKPKPAAEPAFKQTPNRQRTAKARASLQEPDIPDFVLAPGQRKGEAQDQASAGTVLLVMFLSLVIVLGVVGLVLALAGSGVLPDASGVLERMATWFNTHIFPMF